MEAILGALADTNWGMIILCSIIIIAILIDFFDNRPKT